jgi:pimeloyl-ACP methyl ester carboxylesterase
MIKNLLLIGSMVVASAIVLACGNGDDSSPPPPTAASDASTAGDARPDAAEASSPIETAAACTVVVKDADCDRTKRPIVFVHGTYGSGANFENVAALLGSNGYCQDSIVAVEYDSIFVDSPGADCTTTADGGVTPTGCGKVDAVVNKVLADHPSFTQVDLAGHSQGTEHCSQYLANHADKVAHYINFSGVVPVGDVQTLSLSSLHDLGGHPNHATGTSICTAAGVPAGCNVTQITLVDEDHFAVAASRHSFIQVYKYLNSGTNPTYDEVQCGDDPVTIEGLSETFADNTPNTGKIEVHELGTTPRMPGASVMLDPPDATGHFGPISLKRNVPYEFVGYDAKGNLVGYAYYTPFKRSNRLVRMLAPASASDGSPVGAEVAAASTDHAIRSPNSVTVVAQWAGGAFRQDLGASLLVDGKEVLTDANAGNTALMNSSLAGGVVGLFMDDANKNGKTDLGLAYATSFVAFTDVFMQAKTPAFVELSFTPGAEDFATIDNIAAISNWPSSAGLISVTFQ